MSALGDKPSRQQIYAKFGSWTNDLITNRSLNQMYGLCFGGSGHSRLSFAVKDLPSVTGYNYTVDSNDNLFVTFEGLDTGGLNTTLKIEIQDRFRNGNELVEPDDNDWESLYQSTTGDDGDRTLAVALDSGNWFLRFTIYNGFIQNPKDWIEVDWVKADSQGSSTPSQTWPTPGIDTATWDGGRGVITTWPYDDAPEFEAQMRLNSSSSSAWESAQLDFQSDVNWGTNNNPKEATWLGNSFYVSGDVVDVRIRAKTGGGKSQSNWSTPATINI